MTRSHPPQKIPTERPGQRGGKRDRNRREKTRRVCEAALPLFLEQGIESVSINQIVEAASIPKGSFYRYFEDKRGLVATLFAPIATATAEAMEECEAKLGDARTADELITAYQQMAFALAPILLEEADIVRLYLQESRAPGEGDRAPVREIADQITESAIRLTKAARTHGLLRDIPPPISALAVIGAIERLLFAHFAGRDLGEPLAAAEHIVTLVLDGIRAH